MKLVKKLAINFLVGAVTATGAYVGNRACREADKHITEEINKKHEEPEMKANPIGFIR